MSAATRLRAIAGGLKTRLYRNPRDFLRKLRSWGLTNFLLSEKWEAEMREAVSHLPVLAPPPIELDVCFLTGGRFWHQTAFCAWSFQACAAAAPRVRIYDDGSLTGEGRDQLTRLFPGIQCQSQAETRAILDAHLPEAEFPVLRRKWGNYPNIRKLIDVHAGSRGPKLVLDSDMLFFQEPAEILAWARQADRPIHMEERTEFYGYPREALERLAGAPLPIGLNVGICGLLSEEIPWPRVEEWTRTLIGEYGDSYFLEQALGAMLCAREDRVRLPASRYLVLPSFAEVRNPSAVLHHYVNESRPLLFRSGWRRMMTRAARAQPAGAR